jgi:hypothetical protein
MPTMRADDGRVRLAKEQVMSAARALSVELGVPDAQVTPSVPTRSLSA